MKKTVFLLTLCFAVNLLGVTSAEGERDVVVTVPVPGVYWVNVHSRSKLPVGREHFAEFQWDGSVWQHRRLLQSNQIEKVQQINRIMLDSTPHKLRYRLNSDEVEILKIYFKPETSVEVPDAAKKYNPPFVPPAHHPRVMVNPAELKKIRENLKKGINAEVWTKVRISACTPFLFKPDTKKEVMYDPQIATAISEKAFYYLVTEDTKVGKEAIDLTLTYLQNVSFGNGQDICRKVGEIIYRSSQVYDWCYSLMTPEERTAMREKMIFFAGEMEIGWPPFKQSVVLGHGNEAQMSRDLLAMAIAVYDENPEPFRYAMYTMLTMFETSKRYLYQSGRHDQGSGYGGYRYMWDMFAALQFRRTFGYEILPPEAAKVPYYWHYIRTPDNRFLIEGDASWNWTNRHIVNKQMFFTNLALWPDPELKEELRRGNPKLDYPDDQVFFLLVNDPQLLPKDNRAELPLTQFYNNPLPGMIARTGWNFSRLADDVVVSMHGAQYHYRNHQHLDMGAFQIYFRGNLAADLGQYRTYGVPYDWNFAKSSASHSVMLFRDPQQKNRQMGMQFTANSGTQEVKGWWPAEDLNVQMKDDTFRNGSTLRAGWGPLLDKPLYSFMETDLGSLYPNRVKSYSRSFVFLNIGLQSTPAVLIVLDRFEKSAAHIEPIFQLTSISKPYEKEGHVEVTAAPYGKAGKITIQTLLPIDAKNRILSGKDAFTLDGQYFPPSIPSAPEANGSRTEISGDGGVFLNLIQIQDGAASPLSVKKQEENGRITLEIANRIISFGNALQTTDSIITFNVTQKETQVLLLDLSFGIWELQVNRNIIGKTEITTDKGSFFAILEPGIYTLTLTPNSKAFPMEIPNLAPQSVRKPPRNRIFINGKILSDIRTVPVGKKGQILIPLAKLIPEKISADGQALSFQSHGFNLILKAGDKEVRIGNLVLSLNEKLSPGEFQLPANLAAGLLNLSLDLDQDSASVFMTSVKSPGKVLMVDADEKSTEFWRLMNGEQMEWAVLGRHVGVEILFAEPLELDAISLKWAHGTVCKTSFRIEVSSNVKMFNKVFDGLSSGKTMDYEKITFPKQKVQSLRFLFRGNDVDAWNNLSGIRFE